MATGASKDSLYSRLGGYDAIAAAWTTSYPDCVKIHYYGGFGPVRVASIPTTVNGN